MNFCRNGSLWTRGERENKRGTSGASNQMQRSTGYIVISNGKSSIYVLWHAPEGFVEWRGNAWRSIETTG